MNATRAGKPVRAASRTRTAVAGGAHPLPVTASAFVVARLRDAILGGELAPGQRLRQQALAAELGFSHVPLREALQRLELEGFVEISPHRGAFVVPLVAADAAELFQLRVELETAVLRASAQNISADQLDRLCAIHAAANKEKDKLRYGELNWQFHSALYAASGRPRTLKLIMEVRSSKSVSSRMRRKNASESNARPGS